MKNLTFLLLFLLLPNWANAQVRTVVAGQIENNPNQPVMLLVYHFDLQTMKEVESIHQVKCQADRTFTFVLDDISRPMTRCRLGFRNEGVPLRLSPGDSLQARFTFGNIDSTVVFTGTHANINQYLKEYQLTFSPWQRQKFLGEMEGDSTLLPGLRQWYLKKQLFLRMANENGQLGQAFAEREADRITYEYLDQLLAADIRHALGDTLWSINVLPELVLGKIDRDSSWLQVPEYRSYVLNHLEMQLNRNHPDQIRLADRLELAGQNLSGPVLTWYSYSQIQQALRMTRDRADKLVLRDYLLRRSVDPGLVMLLKGNEQEYAGYTYMESHSNVTEAFIYVVAFLLFAAALVLLVVVFRFLLSPPNLKKPATIQIILFLGGILVCAILYLIWDFRPGNRQVAILRVLTFLGFLVANALFILPAGLKGRKWKFFAGEFAISALFVAAMILLANHQGNPGSASRWFDDYRHLSIGLSGTIILIGSFLLHYLIKAFYEGKSITDLVREKRIDWELIFHTAFVFFMISDALVYSLHHRSLQEITIAFTGIGIFYLHTFLLVPNCIGKKAILPYLASSLGVFVVSCLLFYIPDRMEFSRAITQFGLDLSAAEVLVWPGSKIFREALVLQLLVVAAWVYALVRIALQQKNIGFKLLQTKQAELSQLRSQVNPHFLFNSLNTLYAFALKENNSRTAEYIARLANLMRYLVDDMARERIPVSHEIRYIRDFIDIQIIRCSVAPEVIFDDGIGEESGLQIAPMLMIPFVENAFKHGINPTAASELLLRFSLDDQCFRFVIENSVSPEPASFYQEKGFGFGIENVRQRLQHQYSGRHTLLIEESADRFKVSLEINLE
jgi:hypothetical protein